MGTKTIYLPDSARPGLPRTALPKQVESEVMRENRQMLEELYEVTGKLEEYNRELRQIDEYLSVVMAKPNTTVDGLKPGYYHLVRRRPGHPAYIKPIEWDDGSWRDLDSSVFDIVKEEDLWNDRTQRELRKRREAAEEARRRQKVREGQDRAAEFDDRLWHATHTSVSIPRGI